MPNLSFLNNSVSPSSESTCATKNFHLKAVKGPKKHWGFVRSIVQQGRDGLLLRTTQGLQETLRILSIPPDTRPDDDAKFLYRWIMSQENISMLQGMSDVTGSSICREMELLVAKSGDIIMHQGDQGFYCYILLTGRVAVYIRDTKSQQQHEKLKWETSENRVKGQINKGTKVATLNPGKVFGDVVLEDPTLKRNATIAVDSGVKIAKMIAVNQAAFQRVLHSHRQEESVLKHICFLKQLYIFKDWSKDQLIQLTTGAIKVQTYQSMDYIIRRGDEIESLLFIKKGEAKELSRVLITRGSKNSENRSFDSKVTAEVSFLSRFDIIGSSCTLPGRQSKFSQVDIQASVETTVIALSRRNVHSHIQTVRLPYARHSAALLRAMANSRTEWHATRIQQVRQFPNLHIPITRKMMRLSGTFCTLCGIRTHVAGDSLCLLVRNVSTKIDVMKKQHFQDPHKGTGPSFASKETKRAEKRITEVSSNSMVHYKKEILEKCGIDSNSIGLRRRAEGQGGEARHSAPDGSEKEPSAKIQLKIDSIRKSWPYNFVSSNS